MWFLLFFLYFGHHVVAQTTTVTDCGSKTPTIDASTGLPTSSNQIACLSYGTTHFMTTPAAPAQAKRVPGFSAHNNKIPFAGSYAAQRGSVSPTLKAHAHVNHPNVFAGTPFEAQFAALITMFQNTGKKTQTVSPGQMQSLTSQYKKTGQETSVSAGTNATTKDLSHFVPLWRKVQFMVLNDLYIYLTGVYSAFNLSQPHVSVGIPYLVTTDKTGYYDLEAAYALNKKALVVSHLLNVIQSQMFYICSHHQPLITGSLSLKVGRIMLDQDKTVDPTILIQDFSSQSADIQKSALAGQQVYRAAFKQVLDFFTAYTGMLSADPSSFIAMAQKIADAMTAADTLKAQVKAQITGKSMDTKTKISTFRSLKTQYPSINPPFFYYDKETIRALRLLPALGTEIETAKPQTYGWPAQLVAKAAAGTVAKNAQGVSLGYPVAYFVDAQNNNTTDQTKAAKLFINLPTNQMITEGTTIAQGGIYAQEIIKQPDWLNTKAGIISIVRACLGDFSQLRGKGILQPCTEAIICNAQGENICPATTQAECSKELQVINATQAAYQQQLVQTQAAATAQTQTASVTGSSSAATSVTPATSIQGAS